MACNQQAQGVLAGQGKRSTAITRLLSKTNSSTAVRMVGPSFLGTRCSSESQMVLLNMPACHTQEILQRLCPHFSRLGANFSTQRLRQSSISFIGMLPQSLRVQPETPGLRHLILRAASMTNWSQLDSTKRMGYLRVGQENWMKMHFQRYSGVSTPEHSLFGGASSTFDSFIRTSIGLGSALSLIELLSTSSIFINCLSALTNISPRYSPFSSTESCLLTNGSQKTPESATPKTVLGLGTRVLKQSTHKQVAIPPAEDPLTTIRSAWARLYLLSAHLICERVLTAPLKQSCLSLYWMGDLLLPWWKAPSQYIITILVQLAKRDFEESVARMPPSVPSQLSGQTFEVPNSPLLRLQQDSRVEARSVPMQAPPPMKQKRTFLVSPPSWRQIMGLLPSRHFAYGSVLWISFWQTLPAEARASSAASRRAVNVFMLDLMNNLL